VPTDQNLADTVAAVLGAPVARTARVHGGDVARSFRIDPVRA
jgi:hypothetical protein